MITSFAIILGFLLLGETISNLFNLSVPGNVIGMILLTTSLWSGAVKEQWVRPAAKLLIDHMAFLFVPTGVGLILYLEVFSQNFFLLATAVIVSTLITMGVTGLVQQKLEKKGEQK